MPATRVGDLADLNERNSGELWVIVINVTLDLEATAIGSGKDGQHAFNGKRSGRAPAGWAGPQFSSPTGEIHRAAEPSATEGI